MQFTDIGGVTLHYEHRAGGPGKPLIVFANSLGTDFRIWREVADDLAADFSTLCYDMRGHGLSGLGSPPYAIADHVADLSGLLDFVGARDVIVCGLSVGGLVAQGLYAIRPEIVRALILCDTAHKIGTAESWNARIDAVRRNGIDSLAESILKLWFTPSFHAEKPTLLAGCRAMLARQPVEGYAGTCAAVRDADHTEAVGRIEVPTLCLVGDQDGSTPPPLVRSMADLIPGAEFAVIENAGHIPCVEQPAQLVARMREFLARKRLGGLADA
jgi:3-oxoadipate enol-lactonase